METSAPNDGRAPRLDRLLRFLEDDPANLSLIADAASAALEAGEPATAAKLIAAYEALAPAPPAILNLKGLAALVEGQLVDAEAAFSALVSAGEAAPEVSFNLAWTRCLLGDDAGALEVLSDEALAASPLSPALKVQALHRLGRVDEALSVGQALVARFPDNASLLGALSLAAIDLEDIALAKAYALKAGDNADGLATLGMLELGEQDVRSARTAFDASLRARPDNPRALLGSGLEQLIRGEAMAGAAEIDAAAELFADHLGSWVAAGWAYLIAGDAAQSRRRFETALALDDTFAETHGGLAVLDILAGDIPSAERRCDIALRLDRTCLGGTLAKVLLLTSQGRQDAADRIRALALNRPLAPGGRSIAEVMAGFGLRSGRR